MPVVPSAAPSGALMPEGRHRWQEKPVDKEGPSGLGWHQLMEGEQGASCCRRQAQLAEEGHEGLRGGWHGQALGGYHAKRLGQGGGNACSHPCTAKHRAANRRFLPYSRGASGWLCTFSAWLRLVQEMMVGSKGTVAGLRS